MTTLQHQSCKMGSAAEAVAFKYIYIYMYIYTYIYIYIYIHIYGIEGSNPSFQRVYEGFRVKLGVVSGEVR